MLRDFSYNFPASVMRSFFRGSNFLWHLLAIILTYIFVTSGFDWFYFQSTRDEWFKLVGFSAGFLGFLVPIMMPISFYLFGKVQNSVILKNVAAALGQAAIIGWLISSSYKAFTGRLHPELVTSISTVDISRDFNFGFFNEGIFWGWPSSHTTVAFAMAITLIVLYPRQKKIILPAAGYALYIGFGAAGNFHWFSDVVAGAIIGTIVGLVVANSYRERGMKVAV